MTLLGEYVSIPVSIGVSTDISKGCLTSDGLICLIDGAQSLMDGAVTTFATRANLWALGSSLVTISQYLTRDRLHIR